jgi:hypothetical protein
MKSNKPKRFSPPPQRKPKFNLPQAPKFTARNPQTGVKATGTTRFQAETRLRNKAGGK